MTLLDNYSEIDLLTMLGLMKDDRLTNAGYFLFSNSQPTVLKMAVYGTDERINFIDINRISDNVFNLIDIATTYISEYMNWKVEFDDKSTSRIEVPEVPIEAIREIVVNAFAHANYRTVTEHEIPITPTIIDIYNPGESVKLPTGIKAYFGEDEVLLFVVRSSMGFKYNIRLCNQVGIIDADYYNNSSNEGHMWIRIQNEGDEVVKFNRGEAVVQGIFMKYLTTDTDENINIERSSDY